MAYNAAVYLTGLAAQAEADGHAAQAAHLRGMAKEAKAKERAAKATQRAMQKSARRTPKDPNRRIALIRHLANRMSEVVNDPSWGP